MLIMLTHARLVSCCQMKMVCQVQGAALPRTPRLIRIWSLSHQLIMAFQVVWKKAVTVDRALRWCGRRVLVEFVV